MKISAVIITFNEEEKIEAAIRSVDFADEVLVVDSESTDATREKAAGLGARVIVKPWVGFSEQKQFATDNAAYDRILSLDADERLSDELKLELLAIRDQREPADGYRVPRLAIYMGHEVRHSGWYPDWQLRFFDRTKGRWKKVAIHESVEMEPGSRIDKLRGNLIHLTIDDPSEHVEMIRSRYAPMSAAAMHEAGRRASVLKTWTLPLITFLQTYFIKAGFLDGAAGLRISYFAAYNVYLKHKILRDIQAK